MSAPKISLLYDVKTAQVYYLLKKYGISCRSNTEKNTSFSVNHDFFECIDSADKAYWLGFLYADGYVTKQHKIGLALSKADASHVEQFRKAVESTHTIHSYFSRGFSRSEYVRLIFSSQKMVKDLERLGCVQQKSLILAFPSDKQVPSTYLKDFVRGYIDGDGSITTGGKHHPIRLKICGTRQFLGGLREYFNTIIAPDKIETELEKRHKDSKNNYSLTVNSSQRVLRILDELYNGATTYLDRKYTLYLRKCSALKQSSLPEMVGV